MRLLGRKARNDGTPGTKKPASENWRFRVMAEREGLLGLRPHPCGAAVGLFEAASVLRRLWRLVEPPFRYRGFESCDRSIKKGPLGALV